MVTISHYVDVSTTIRAQLVAKRGLLGVSKSNGFNVPAMLSTDMLGAVAMFVNGLISAVNRLSLGPADRPMCLALEYINDDGTPYSAVEIGAIAFESGAAISDDVGINAKRYVAGYATFENLGWVRQLVHPNQSTTARRYGVSRSDEFEILSFLKGAMTAWERMIKATSVSISTYGVTSPVSLDASDEFCRAMQAFAATLDTLNENPPPELIANLKGALRAALDATERTVVDASELAGRAAAEALRLAGEAAGAGAKGFLEGVGIMPLAVAALAVYIAVQAKFI